MQGISGLVVDPIKGAKADGVAGLFKVAGCVEAAVADVI